MAVHKKSLIASRDAVKKAKIATNSSPVAKEGEAAGTRAVRAVRAVRSVRSVRSVRTVRPLYY